MGEPKLMTCTKGYTARSYKLAADRTYLATLWALI